MASKRTPTAKSRTTSTKPKPKTETPAKIESEVAELTGIEEVSPFQEPTPEAPETAPATETSEPAGKMPATAKPLRIHYSVIGEIEVLDDAGNIMQLDHGRIRGEYILRVIRRAQ